MKNHFYILLLCIICIACEKKQQTSFYFWKTSYQLSANEQKYLDSLGVQKLYVRFFDVDIKNGKPLPIGEIKIQTQNTKQEIIPVVFITNETFAQIDQKNIEKLATHIQKEIAFLFPKISSKLLKEIQFDCDWTSSTQANYFSFLKIIQQNNPDLSVSVTIRLHQIKDKIKTGVPPVNKGVLMYYATSNPLTFDAKNSILDNTLAKNYISTLADYPIALDLALPIYSWAIVQNQVGEKKLINGIRNADLRDTTLYQALASNFYFIKKDHYLKGNFLYEDYTLKVEELSTQELNIAYKNFIKKNKKKELTTIFFQLDDATLSQYSIIQLKNILQ